MPRPKRKPPVPEGVLFVRNVPQVTLDALQRIADRTRAERGTMVTRADIVREILHRAVQERAAKW